MAHHASTPKAVLDAPQSTPDVTSAQHGFSRSERRHGVYAHPSMTPEAKATAHAAAVAAGRNQPATSTKVAKVRKGRKARWN